MEKIHIKTLGNDPFFLFIGVHYIFFFLTGVHISILCGLKLLPVVKKKSFCSFLKEAE